MKRKDQIPDDDIVGLDPWAMAVRDELAGSRRLFPQPWQAGPVTVEACAGRGSVWIVARWARGGGVAFRAACAPGAALSFEDAVIEAGAARVQATTSLGRFRVEISLSENGLLRWTTWLTPKADLLLPFWPRDIYPLNSADDPAPTRGTVHAAQPDSGAALLFLTLTHPRSGSLLYLQNITALNPLFQALEAQPGCLVGGTWPQFGFALPTSEDKPLPGGREVVVSDALVRFSPTVPGDERQAARLFLDLLADVYPRLPQPETQWRDWPRRAEETVRDLSGSGECTILDKGRLYARPYLGAEYPDSMVQLALLLPLREYAGWRGQAIPLADELRRGVPAFYDSTLKTIRRYLPSVGEDKNANEVDSWYLYHPLLDLARLAGMGDAEAKTLLLDSVDCGIRIARHFDYQWPVQFDVETREVLTGERKPGQPGQSDVGGLYASVMLHVWDLTGKERFLEEAKKGARAMSGYRFAVGYQFNITAIGAAACLRLWRETGDDFYRDQSFVLLASFFQHTTLFESDLGAARFFPTFLGVLCLHDADYMAIFEAFESFAAFHEILSLAGDDLPPSVQMLLTEYCRHLLNRGWFYYPSELPEEALAKEIRNGRLDRTKAIPVEDLYSGGDPAGSVGQEVYGAGAAFAFVSRAFHRLPEVPFLIYCDYPIAEIQHKGEYVHLRVRGVSEFSCRLRLIPDSGQSLPSVQVTKGDGQAVPGNPTPEGHCEYTVPGDASLDIKWHTE